MPTSDTQSVATTLPARYYTDPDFFRDELERFYCNSWICAGRADQIPAPGDFFVREVARESIIVTRDGGGSVRAFFNVCRHRGTRICAGGEGHFAGRIQCGYHGWTYGLDGSLIGAPHAQDGFRRKIIPSIAFRPRSGTATSLLTSAQSLRRWPVSWKICRRNSRTGKWLR